MGYLNQLDPLIIFAILLGFSLLIPEFLRRYRILIIPPYILVGILLWIVLKELFPEITDIECLPTLDLLAEIGIIVLVFEAGLGFMNTPMKCTTRHDHIDTKIWGIFLSWRLNNV